MFGWKAIERKLFCVLVAIVTTTRLTLLCANQARRRRRRRRGWSVNTGWLCPHTSTRTTPPEDITWQTILVGECCSSTLLIYLNWEKLDCKRSSLSLWHCFFQAFSIAFYVTSKMERSQQKTSHVPLHSSLYFFLSFVVLLSLFFLLLLLNISPLTLLLLYNLFSFSLP